MPKGDKTGLPTMFLIRHGETAWSLSGQHTGHSDIPLTEHGEAMALDLAPLLNSVSFSHVLTSPRLRARRTCELAGNSRSAVIDPDLAEWDCVGTLCRRSASIVAIRIDVLLTLSRPSELSFFASGVSAEPLSGKLERSRRFPLLNVINNFAINHLESKHSYRRRSLHIGA